MIIFMFLLCRQRSGGRWTNQVNNNQLDFLLCTLAVRRCKPFKFHPYPFSLFLILLRY